MKSGLTERILFEALCEEANLTQTSRPERFLLRGLYLVIACILVFCVALREYTVRLIFLDSTAMQFISSLAHLPPLFDSLAPLLTTCFGLLVLMLLRRNSIEEQSLLSRDICCMLNIFTWFFLMYVVADAQNAFCLVAMLTVLDIQKDNRRNSIYIAVLFVLFVFVGANMLHQPRTFSVTAFIDYYEPRTRAALYMLRNVLYSTVTALTIIDLILKMQSFSRENRLILQLNSALHNTTTQLEASNTALQDYARQSQIVAKTQERNRLAREIHDTLGHTLSGIATGLEVCLELSTETDKTVLTYLTRARSMALDGLEDVRRSINELRPDLLERMDFPSAVQSCIERFCQLQRVKIRLRVEGTIALLDQEEEETAFRIVQESLTNAVRHGGAEFIEVTLRFRPGWLYLDVSDDGCGVSELAPGFGVKHMRERVVFLGGYIDFYNVAAGGLHVAAGIPVRRRDCRD